MKHTKRIVVITVLGMVLVGGAVTVRIMSQPAVGSAPVRSAAAATPAPILQDQPAAAGNIDNDYFGLTLPDGFAIQSQQSPSGTNLAVYSLTKPSLGGTIVVAIRMSATPAGGMTQDTGYMVRAQQSERYKAVSLKASGIDTVTFADMQSGGVVAFIDGGQYMATISASSGLGNPGAAEQAAATESLSQLLTQWRWKS